MCKIKIFPWSFTHSLSPSRRLNYCQTFQWLFSFESHIPIRSNKYQVSSIAKSCWRYIYITNSHHAAMCSASEGHGLYSPAGQESGEGCLGSKACASATPALPWLLRHVLCPPARDGRWAMDAQLADWAVQGNVWLVEWVTWYLGYLKIH